MVIFIRVIALFVVSALVEEVSIFVEIIEFIVFIEGVFFKRDFLISWVVVDLAFVNLHLSHLNQWDFSDLLRIISKRVVSD